MNLSNENGDLILKIIGGLIAFFSFRWLVKIFAGKDGDLDKEELKKLTAYILFIWAFVYVLVKEGSRPSGTEHVFSEIWLFFIISALLTVLSLERIFESFSKLIELLIRLRTKIPNETKPDNSSDNASRGAGSRIPDSSETGQTDKEGV